MNSFFANNDKIVEFPALIISVLNNQPHLLAHSFRSRGLLEPMQSLRLDRYKTQFSQYDSDLVGNYLYRLNCSNLIIHLTAPFYFFILGSFLIMLDGSLSLINI